MQCSSHCTSRPRVTVLRPSLAAPYRLTAKARPGPLRTPLVVRAFEENGNTATKPRPAPPSSKVPETKVTETNGAAAPAASNGNGNGNGAAAHAAVGPLRKEWLLKETPQEVLDFVEGRQNGAAVAPDKEEKSKPALTPAESSTWRSWLLKETPQEVLDMVEAYNLGYKGRGALSVPWPMKRSWTEIFLDRVVDTVDDVGQHVRRQVMELPTVRAMDDLVSRRGPTIVTPKGKTKKPVVVVLGFGWGAHALIKVIDVEQYDVICVSPRNFFMFTPMLPSTAVGTVEFRSLLEPIRCANPFVEYCAASCDSIDLKRKVALCTSAVAFEDGNRPQFEVPYDILVCAHGEQPATFGVKGVEEYAFFMKEINDTQGLRKRIQEMFELASLPGTSEEEKRRILHCVVVGGGPTGVEFAGTLSDFVREDLKARYPELMPYVRISLLQAGPTILMQFDPELAERAVKILKDTGVEVRTNMAVTEITVDNVTLKDKEGNLTKEGYGICVWSAGNAPRPLTKALIEQIPEQAEYNTHPFSKKIAVDPYMRVIGAEDVIGIGDATKMVGSPLPATAQVASQQGAYIAHYINRRYQVGAGGMSAEPPVKPARGMRWIDRITGSVDLDDYTEEPLLYYKKPFEFLNLGILAYLGNGKALSQVVAFDQTLKFSGDVAFFMWRSVYITKQVSLRNRVLILFDWLKTRVFGRDLSQF